MIGFIIAGLVIGAVARLIKPGRQRIGLLATLLVGVVSSVIAGTIVNLLGTGDIFELNILGTIVAVIVAIVILGLINAGGGRRDDRSRA